MVLGFVFLRGFHEPCRAQNLSRISYTINDNWKFFPDDAGDAEKRNFPDDSWQKISLPHTWNAADTLDDEPGYRRGAGWYRRVLNLNANLKNKRLFLYFEGANQVADVFVNERRAGRHTGGYTAFALEITDFARFDEPNLVAVRVDNSLVKDIPPINGDFNMYGGIYRDVWLVGTNEIHFKIDDFASSGVKIETPQVSAGSATVKISGTIVNAGERTGEIEIVSTILDGENRTVTSIASKLRVGAKAEANFVQASSGEIQTPKLWSPDNPYLYKVRTEIRADGKILDEINNPLGFRWFTFDASKGFFLNGKPLKLRGTNRHQDYAGMGNAVPDSLQVRDLEIIKENGFNFVRLAHYPQDPSVLEAADRLGLLIWEEIPIVNQIHPSPGFNENAAAMLREMIRQHRNHPSIIIWGYMNEVFLPVPKTEEHVQATVRLARRLEEICRTEDATRFTAIAFDHGARELYNASGLGEITRIVGWNLYHGWYYETFADFGKFLDEEHRKFPRRSLIVSEYGANGDRRLHSLAPKRFDSTIEWQRMFHEAYLPQINSRPFVAGAAIWNQFDFGSEFRGETIPHINQKGMFTFERRPKDVSFFYKANFSPAAVLHIAARDWPYRTGAARAAIDVYTNLSSVELFHDGVSLGKKTSGANRKASWEVSLKDGINIFTARGAKGKNPVSDSAEIYFEGLSNFKEIAVNVGSNAEFTDEAKIVWRADQPFQKGSWGFLGNEAKPVSTGQNVLGTLDDPLFQTMLENLSGYRFDVPDGHYEIELRFVETRHKEPGKRIFDVKINEQMFLEKLDLARENGFMKSFSRKFRASARDGQGISLDFAGQTGPAILSAVRIRRVL